MMKKFHLDIVMCIACTTMAETVVLHHRNVGIGTKAAVERAAVEPTAVEPTASIGFGG